MALKRADESHMSTSNDKLRLLMEACIRVPMTEDESEWSFPSSYLPLSLVGG